MFDELREILIEAQSKKDKLLAEDEEIYAKAVENTKLLALEIWKSLINQYLTTDNKYLEVNRYYRKLEIWNVACCKDGIKVNAYNKRKGKDEISYVELLLDGDSPYVPNYKPVVFSYLKKILKSDGLNVSLKENKSIGVEIKCWIHPFKFANIISKVQLDSEEVNSKSNVLKRERKLECIDDYKDKLLLSLKKDEF